MCLYSQTCYEFVAQSSVCELFALNSPSCLQTADVFACHRHVYRATNIELGVQQKPATHPNCRSRPLLRVITWSVKI